MLRDYRILALLTLMICVLIGASVFNALQADWQKHQKEYYKQLKVEDYTIEVVQQNISTPNGILIDRCTSCHLGAANEDAEGLEQPLKTHSLIVPGMKNNIHDLNKIGCSVCHDGNGRGLEKDDAHGHLKHWTLPLVAGYMTQASCSKCHSINDIDLKGADYLNMGRRLFLEKACWACHAIENVSSGTRGPNLSNAGNQFSVDYLRTSIVAPKDNISSSKMPEFDWIHEGDKSKKKIEALVVYLKSQRAFKLRDSQKAPVEYRSTGRKERPRPSIASIELGQAIFNARDNGDSIRGGCINCHSYSTEAPMKENGKWVTTFVGSSIAPELTFAVATRGKQFVKDHIKNPSIHVIDSIMPKFVTDDPKNSFNEVELESLALFLESLGKKPVVNEPAALYARFCVSCHGEDFDGKGRNNQRNMLLDPLPRNFRHQFVLSYEERISNSIKNGIPGTAMPPWKNLLNDEQVSSLVQYIKTEVSKNKELDKKPFMRPEIALPEVGDTDRMTNDILIAGDVEKGGIGFAKFCTGCHGKLANGKGPDAYYLVHPLPRNLINGEFMTQSEVTDERLFQSILLGVPGTPMPPHERLISDQKILDIIAYLKSLNKNDKEN